MNDTDLKQQNDISKLWSAVVEIRTALVGIDGSNGLRGELRDFISETRNRDLEISKWQEKVEEQWTHYLTNDRAATCIGAKRLEAYIEAQKERTSERRAIDVTVIEYKKAINVALITSMSSIFVAIASIIAGFLSK